MKKKPLERTQVYLSVRQLRALDVLAGRDSVSRAEIIRRAVDRFLDMGYKE